MESVTGKEFHVTHRLVMRRGWGAYVSIAIYDRRMCREPRWVDNNSENEWVGSVWSRQIWESSDGGISTWKMRVDRALREAQEKADILNGMQRFAEQSSQIYREASKLVTQYLLEAESELAERTKLAVISV